MDHFSQFRESITKILVTGLFRRDAPGFDIKQIIDGNNSLFTHLHKYDENISGSHVFRALRDGVHYVNAIDKPQRLVFLMAFSNFDEYRKFLDDKKTI